MFDRDVATDSNACLHHVFERAARARPDAVAVTASDGELTYGQLDAAASRLAARLAELGVGPEVIVALYAGRTTELVIGMLGILKSGGAYLPIDTTFPAERVRWTIADSGATVVVTAGPVEAVSLAGVTVVGIDADSSGNSPPVAPDPQVSPGNLAYVIYTSGSTGVPKGVLIEHGSAVRLFQQTDRWFGFGPSDVWTMFHSSAFDFSVWEIWGALSYGGRVVIVPYEVSRSPAAFLDLLGREGVTVLNQTPTALRQLMAAEATRPEATLGSLRVVVLGGERLDVAMLEPWMARHGQRLPKVVNMYGITETTVHASYRPIDRADLTDQPVSPIGIPLPDLSFEILDEGGLPVVPGEPGELYVSGPGLARGYLNRDDLTAARFVHLPDPSGPRFYRTGDRVVRLDDGQYGYIGRIDDQIKVRGFRVEPAEVEAVLSSHPEVGSSVVVARDYGDGDVRLIAYLLPAAGATPDDGWLARVQKEVADRVAQALPAHMRPSTYLSLAALPMTPNGKVDRSALSVPGDEAAGRASSNLVGLAGPAGQEPTSTQAVIAGMWCSILDVPTIDVDDDFFDAGGTSLALVRMFDLVNETFATDLDISVLLDGATVAVLAASVDREQNARPTAAPRGTR